MLLHKHWKLVYTYIYKKHTHIYVSIHIFTYIYVYICVCVCLCVRVCVRVYVIFCAWPLQSSCQRLYITVVDWLHAQSNTASLKQFLCLGMCNVAASAPLLTGNNQGSIRAMAPSLEI